jgi:acyl-CoA reductase-like NAD-dependent aldehyde dehydrogenase
MPKPKAQYADRWRPCNPGPGNWFQPTVFSNVNHSMELMREESFGPVIGIQKVSW